MDYSPYLEICKLKTSYKISKDEIISRKIIPLYEKENEVFILCSNGSDDNTEYIFDRYNKQVKYIFTTNEEINRLLKILYYNNNLCENTIINEAISYSASDIHFEPFLDEVLVRFRVNGVLILYMKLQVEDYVSLLSRLKIKSEMDITERKKPQDGRINFYANNEEYNLRLATIPVVFGEKLVVRIMFNDKVNSSIEGLNFTDTQIKDINKIMKLSNGMVVVCGPTGSGKSTTIYNILKTINNTSTNILTLEDPVEIIINGINQISLNEKKGLTFSEGLKSCLRQDPDVIMIGEIRDSLTAKIAVRAAITGHKVYTTIHAKSPREVYFRLSDMGVNEYLLKECIKGIVSQRLVNILCSNCKKEIQKVNYNNKLITLYKKCGCSLCSGSGYVSRKMISTVVYMDKDNKKELTRIKDDENILSNSEMLFNLNELLQKGDIDYNDYINFIEEEDLGYEKLRQYIINYGESS